MSERPMSSLRWRVGGPKAAMLAACALPLAPWWLLPVLGAVLVLAWSWVAFLAVGAGLLVRRPTLWPWLTLAAGFVASLWLLEPVVRGRALLEWTPRGANRSSLRGRWIAAQLILLRLTWRGHGPGAARRDLRRWTSRGVKGLPTDTLYCEPLRVLYEYGVLGALGLALLIGGFVTVVPRGTGWFAVGVTFAVCSLGHAPTHYAASWAARQFRRLVPKPPLLADLTIHVLADGTFAYYGDIERYDAAYQRAQWALIAAAVLRAGKHLADAHGLTIEEIGLEPSHG